MSERRGSPVRTIVLVVLGLLVVCVIAFGALFGAMFGWKALFARTHDPGAGRELFERVTQRMDQQQQTSAADNGYDDLRDFLAPSPAPTVPVLKQITVLQGSTIEATEQNLAANPTNRSQALRDFEAQVLPKLRAALQKSAFVFPIDWRQGFLGSVPNFVNLRAMAIALTIHGLDLERQKKYTAAADDYLAAISLGQRAGRSGALIHQMISIAMIRIGVDPLSRLLSAHVLPTSTLRRIVRELPATVPDRAAFLACTDVEYVLAIQSLDLATQGKLNPMSMGQSGSGGLVERLFGPMFARRAAAIFQNYYLEARPFIANLDRGGLSTFTVASSKALGNTEVAVFLPSLEKPMSVFIAVRAMLEGAIVAAALEGWKTEHGRYPNALADLVPSWLTAVPDDPTTGKPFIYQPDGTLSSTSDVWPQLHLPTTLRLHPWTPPPTP